MTGESFRKAPFEVVETFLDVGVCPDCNSRAELRQVADLVFVLTVEHDATCPWLRQHGDEP